MRPTLYVIRTVWKAPRRRETNPPVKSPEPQAAAAERAKVAARRGGIKDGLRR
jgi:hypothetical protein